ncbi:CLUMA_CG016793, isoform A [Clunio marinus]|uniref:CLUMA_CG016793, isoform A n=1 Tax=Clunio marinus TaxID=568069 RepID=A0A1J1ISA1_9DIPT|nr:CLUMA_CG016793, isoform A [Clunio marinus]
MAIKWMSECYKVTRTTSKNSNLWADNKKLFHFYNIETEIKISPFYVTAGSAVSNHMLQKF